MPRAIWSGSISFGLVNIPVQLFAAIEAREVHFHLLHDADGGRIKEQRICSTDGKPVDWEHTIKGYEATNGHVVPVTTEELASLAPEITHTIDIEQFVDVAEIDPLYYDHSYYVAPDKGAARPYQLLHASMSARGKVAIARVVMRTRQYLCAIRAGQEGLVLSTMQYADEIRDPSLIKGLAVAKGKVAPKELKLADQLISSLEAPFEPGKFRDEYRDQLIAYLEKKSKGEQVAATASEVGAEPNVLSLVEALSASLNKRRDAASLNKKRDAAKTPAAPARTRPDRRAKASRAKARVSPRPTARRTHS